MKKFDKCLMLVVVVLWPLVLAAAAVDYAFHSITGYGITPFITGMSVNAVINPVAYGADSTGTTDSSAAFQAIINTGVGAEVLLPAGTFKIGTTLQCPVAASSPSQPLFKFRGAGEGNTRINYVGSGGALINQVETSTGSQNTLGCQFQDMTLDGSGASGTPNGYQFGGTRDAALVNVRVQNFAGSGVEIENASGMFTERYNISGTTTFVNNGNAIYLHCDAGCVNSVEHAGPAQVAAWYNIEVGQVGLLMDGGIFSQNTEWVFNGNVEGVGSNGTLLKLSGTGTTFESTLNDKTECNETSCVRTNVGAGAVFAGGVILGQNGGTYTNVITGSYSQTFTLSFTGLGTFPQALASFPICSTGLEGLFGEENNSAAMCVNGVTATNGGGNHCQIYCNGTNWIQTGALAFSSLKLSNGGVFSSTNNGIANTTPTATFADGTHCGAGGGGNVSGGSTTTQMQVLMGATNPTTECQISFGTAAQCSTAETCWVDDQSTFQPLKAVPVSNTGVNIFAQTDMHGDIVSVGCICL